MSKFKLSHSEINQMYDDAMKETSELEGRNPMQDGIDKVVQLAQSMRQRITGRPQQ